MQRLSSGYIARNREIGADFYPRIATDRSLAGETQDFYQGLLSGLNGAMRLMKVLPESETFAALNFLEIKLANLVDTSDISIEMARPPATDSVIPYLGRLDSNYIDQLKQNIQNINFGQVVDNLFVTGETQDFYQGCIAAVNFAKSICDQELAFIAIGLLEINLAGYVELDKEFERQVPDNLTIENYTVNVSKYSEESTDSGFIRYQSATGAGVVASFADWDELDDNVLFTVYSYAVDDGLTQFNSALHPSMAEASADFVERVRHLGGSVDDVQFFLSDRRKRKLYASLESIEDISKEFEAVRTQQQIHDELLLRQQEISISEQMDLVDELLLEEKDSELPSLVDEFEDELLEQEFEASDRTKKMQNWLIQSILQDLAFSEEDTEYEFDSDWMVYVEDGSIRVVAIENEHLVLQLTIEGEVQSGLSSIDAEELSNRLKKVPSRPENFDILAEEFLKQNDPSGSEQELFVVEGDEVTDINETQRLFAEQILPMATRLFSTGGEDLEDEHEMRLPLENYQLVLRKHRGEVVFVVEAEGRGEIIEAKEGKVIKAQGLTQQDLIAWSEVREDLETNVSEQQGQKGNNGLRRDDSQL